MDFCPLGIAIVDYLLDAGHMVCVESSTEGGADAWWPEGVHCDDLFVVPPGEPLPVACGCEVVPAATAGPETARERLELDLVNDGGGMSARCSLRSSGHRYLLADRSLRDPAEQAHTVSVLREALLEVCVDGLIGLSRNTPAREHAAVPSGGRSVFAEFAAAERDVLSTAQLVRASTGGHEYFHCGDVLGGRGAADGRRTFECKIPEECASVFGPRQAEWLALSLQLLLNSRKEAVYGCFLTTPYGTMARYLELSSDSSLQEVDAALERFPEKILSNRFYQYSEAFGGAPGPGASVVLGGAEDPLPGAPITVRHHASSGSIEISYSSDSPFFAYLSEYVEAFFGTLARAGAHTLFSEFTDLSAGMLRSIAEFNDTARPFDRERPIHRVIEERARRSPDAPALVYEEATWSYRNINEAANRMARYIRERYAPERGEPVALYLERDEGLLVCLLAVLKLGCPYVPLDPSTPLVRTGLVIESSMPSLLLTDVRHSGRFEEADTDVPFVVTDSEETRAAVQAFPGGDLDVAVDGGDLAYVIYTSGTTGRPKGVAVEHRNFMNIAADIGECLRFGASDRMLAVTTIAFDISTLEVFLPLMRGGCVVLAPQKDLLDIGKLLSLVDETGVTVVQATPSLWQLVAQRLEGRALAVRALCGGEALPPQLASDLAAVVDECWNVYGPTETTVWSTRHLITGAAERVPIGHPVANTRCWVLDEQGRPLPPGVVGELHIGGSGVARGYLHDEELTADRFVPAPGGGRMYRTGDLARFGSNGVLEFFGRNDFQVKLRGHRIELGEIESVLTERPEVRQALVVLAEGAGADEGDGRYLAAYYTLTPVPEAQTPEPGELLGYLSESLPGHMVPSIMVPLGEMPLNSNGKVDRGALPDPEEFRSVGRVAPETEAEERICRLWAEVLGRDVGVTDDFFDSGGNSILGILLVNRINRELGTDIRIRDLFREKTVRRLVPLARASEAEFVYQDFMVEGTDREHLWEPFPLTNVQQTYYFGRFNSFELSSVSTHVYSEFLYSEIDHERLEASFNALVERHHALRSVFSDGEQRFLPEVPRYRIEYHDLSGPEELDDVRGRYSHKEYDPEHYPLFDVILSKLDDVYRLHVSFDAIVVDMTSFGVLFDEWARYYRDPELVLPEPRVSYRDYVLAYERVRDSALLDRAQQYWEDKTPDYRTDLNLPLRAHPSEVDKPFFRRKSAVVAAPVWRELLAKCRRFGISPTALVLEVYGQVLGRWSGQDRLCVNLTLFNRLPLHPDVDELVGDFTVLGLFDHRTRRELGIAAKLRRVHDELLSDIDNNLFDGVDVQRLLKRERGLPVNQAVAPAVLTSTLGTGDSGHLFELALDGAYEGVDHSISQTSQVWLDNKAYETAEGFVAEWDYVDQLFDPEVVDAMHAAYCWTLERLADLDWEADDFPLSPLASSDLALIEAANDHHRPRSEHTLVSLCESAMAAPGASERIAVVDSARGEGFRYSELRRDAHRVATALAGVPVGTPIGVLAEKGYAQAVATLGIMAAGAAYVPMSAEWPAGRIGEILAQAGAETVLLSRAQSEREDLREHVRADQRILVIEELVVAEPETGVRLPDVGPDDVAYVIFTSGSTGTPKGVTISHRGAVNTLLAVNERFGVGPDDSVLALSELSFDLSVYDLFGVLAAGGTVVFPSQEDTRHPAAWAELVERHGITIWNSVPQLADLLADEIAGGGERAYSPRVFLLSGDWIPTVLPARLRESAPEAEVVSLGGATEGSIWSIWYRIGDVDPDWASIPYGVAMPNQKMYVLDASGAHCPVGVVGEIHIGGDGVALSYWGDDALTARRYIVHDGLGRLYRTGDLGRWSQEGHIEFLGRDDFQVKLNGYRVELEEIGSKLAQMPGVGRAVAGIQSDDGRQSLVGHLVPSAPAELAGGSSPGTELDKADFLSAARNLIGEATPRHRLGTGPDPGTYARAKSYRRFLPGSVDADLVRKRCADVLGTPSSAGTRRRVEREDWAALLQKLTAVALTGRPTPKYLYPSAGGTYPVRVFAGIAPEAGDLEGCYYHHPLTGDLCLSEQAPRAVTVSNEIALVAHWPAIAPLYGDRSRRFASIEAGHMLGLLAGELEERSLPFEVRHTEEHLDEENTVLCRVRLAQDASGFSPVPLTSACFVREDEGGYAQTGGERRFSLDRFSVFDRTTDTYAVMRDGQCLLSLEGSGAPGEWLSAGYVFQRLRERLHEEGLGTCVIGFDPVENGISTMAVGRVGAGEADAAQSEADTRSLAEVVGEEVGGLLPGYMLPSAYSVLEELPLSSNGKVALDRLPSLRTTGRYVEPGTETERALVEAWAGVLRQPAETLSTADSFFSLGGNSLSAMRLVRVLQREFGFDLSLREFYELDTVTALAGRFDTAVVDVEQEEGEL